MPDFNANVGIYEEQTAQSTSVFYDVNNPTTGTVTSATLSCTETNFTSAGNLLVGANYYMTADGTNWESVTNGATHNFTNTGKDLRWKIVLFRNDQDYNPYITKLKIIYVIT